MNVPQRCMNTDKCDKRVFSRQIECLNSIYVATICETKCVKVAILCSNTAICWFFPLQIERFYDSGRLKWISFIILEKCWQNKHFFLI